MNIIKKLWFFIACILFVGGTTEICAAEGKAGAANWKVYNMELSHTSVSFTIEDVEMEQEAIIHIKGSESEEEMELPFLITSAVENIEVDFPNKQYLVPGKYSIYIEDAKGNESNKMTGKVYQHDLTLTGKAYPNCIHAKKSYSGILHVTATVGFMQYEGEEDAEGNIIIEYPKQEVGTIISVLCQDDYGCSHEYKWTVEDKYMLMPSISVWKESIALNYDHLDQDERLCAQVGEMIYYSPYGCESYSKETNVILYPAVNEDITKIPVWVESTLGSSTDKKEYEISDCKLDSCEYTINAYLSMAKGTVTKNVYGQIPSKVSVVLNNQTYSANVNEAGEFVINYPEQKEWTEMQFVFEDLHGCVCTEKSRVNNVLGNRSVYIAESAILLSGIEAENVPLNAKLFVEINGVQYSSDYSTSENGGRIKVTYPKQVAGTPISVWYRMDDTSKSEISNYTIYNKQYNIGIEARTTYVSGNIIANGQDECNVTAVYAEVDGTKYPCTIQKMVLAEDDEDDLDGILDEGDTYYNYQASYPKQAIGSTVSITVEDADGYVVSKSTVLKNIKPKLVVDKIDSGTTRVTGKTNSNSLVEIKIGKKIYKGKANEKGIFSVKVKSYKAGTNVIVSVETPEGYTSEKSMKVKKADGSITIKKYIYKTSDSVKLTVTKGRKGDRVKIKVGSKTYTKKLTSNKNKQKITIRLKAGAKAGNAVKVTLYDKFGKKKDEIKSIVYVGDSIYVGMSAKEAVLTTWGAPSRKNDWGSFQQWIFESGQTTLYVYIQGGVVTSMQKTNY